MVDPPAIVYVDGFNLYHRALRNTAFKWLDLGRLFELLLPDHRVQRIHYFTAKLDPVPHDRQLPQRQQVYLRALSTIPNLEIHYGHFRVRPRWMPNHPWEYDELGEPLKTGVQHFEEKGSDVNLATRLLVDAFTGATHTQVVVSSDSDLVAPMRYVRGALDRPLGLISPSPEPPKMLLGTNPTFYKQIRAGALVNAQFPDRLWDEFGWFGKPDTWKS